jgi:hypothetical protein
MKTRLRAVAALNLGGKMSKADGTTSDFSAAYKRKSGGPGLAGTWISTEVKASISTLEVAAAAPAGVSITDDSGATFSGQFDGKETPAIGRLKGSKITTIFKKAGANGFEVTNKVDGRRCLPRFTRCPLMARLSLSTVRPPMRRPRNTRSCSTASSRDRTLAASSNRARRPHRIGLGR